MRLSLEGRKEPLEARLTTRERFRKFNCKSIMAGVRAPGTETGWKRGRDLRQEAEVPEIGEELQSEGNPP